MDRRQYPRVNAPVFCRPVGKPFFGRRRASDVSLGGMRLFADEAPATGDRLELELFLPGDVEATCIVEVVWVEPLPEGSPARYDVGVKYVEIANDDKQRISDVLAGDT